MGRLQRGALLSPFTGTSAKNAKNDNEGLYPNLPQFYSTSTQYFPIINRTYAQQRHGVHLPQTPKEKRPTVKTRGLHCDTWHHRRRPLPLPDQHCGRQRIKTKCNWRLLLGDARYRVRNQPLILSRTVLPSSRLVVVCFTYSTHTGGGERCARK